MSNNFPAVPTDLQLVSIQYQVNIPDAGTILAASVISFVGAQTTISTPSGTGWPDMLFTFAFVFDVAGTPGSFDQTTAEAQLTTILTSLCQAIADATGETLAVVQALAKATRLFTFQDSSGSVLTISQAMTF